MSNRSRMMKMALWIVGWTAGLSIGAVAMAGVGDRAAPARAIAGTHGHPAGVPEVHDGLHHRVSPQTGPAARGDWMQPPSSHGAPQDSGPTTLGPLPSHPSLGHTGAPELGRLPPVGGVHHRHD